MILIADSLHNFIGGLAVGSAFLVDIKFGIVIWTVAAIHEIPQELGDFGILINSGWSRKKALLFNMISALTFPIGAIMAYLISSQINVSLLLPFAAGNFLYIAAADLIPQLRSKQLKEQLTQFLSLILRLISIVIKLRIPMVTTMTSPKAPNAYF
ncbi:ZIP family metal transporter [Legionella impletisoli]